MPSLCAKSVEVWRPAKGNFGIWEYPGRRAAPLWCMPMNIGRGSCNEAVFHQLLGKCPSLVASRTENTRKFRFKNKLLSMDATVIDLCASVFDWARFRQTKGAVKLHLLLDHDGYLPEYAVITEGKRHEVRVARQMRFTPGTMLVFDRGYADYDWFHRLGQQKVQFVTRLKDNADYGLIEERETPRRIGVMRDQVIFFYKLARQGKQCFFRRVEFWDEVQNRLLVFLTNQLTLSAATIAAIYKERWAIELFFKALKQSLRVKTFVGTSANALKTQGRKPAPLMLGLARVRCGSQDCGAPGSFYWCDVALTLRSPKELALRSARSGAG